MFNHIYKFSSKKKFQSSTIKLQVEKKISKKFSKSSSDKLSFKKFQKIFKVQIKLTLNEKILKIFLSSLQFMKTRKQFQSSKCKMPGGEIQKILKIFKVQTGSNNSRWLLLKKKNFKVETQIMC